MKSLKNLKKAIEKLNKEQKFDFVIEERRDLGAIAVYDRNENYTYDYAYILSEFTGKFEEDHIYNSLNEAVQLDLGQDAYLDYWDNVIMIICQ